MLRTISTLALFFLFSCGASDKEKKSLALNTPEPRETIGEGSLTLPVYDFEGLQPFLNLKDGTTYIVNFWATWCAPCIKELPYFERITSEYPRGDVQVLLVNLDMPRMWDSHLLPFVEERDLKSRVVVLDDPRQNEWIPKVDQSWSGAIPATLIYNTDKRMFYERPFTYEELKKELSNFKK